MIHSRKTDPAEIFEFVKKFRKQDQITPIAVVPTSFNTVTEEEFKARGVNIVIYANQLTRAGFPAMQNAARTILENHRAKECDDFCMSFKDSKYHCQSVRSATTCCSFSGVNRYVDKYGFLTFPE